jgi:ABC-type ATPase with predicted acetyltransferase domain
MTGSLISPVIQWFHDGSRVEITVDTSLNGIQREAFDQYLVYKTFEKNQANDLATIPIEIEHADSKNEPCIQAIDFIAGALHY